MEFTHGNAEKLKFYFLKIGKSNCERLVLLTIVTKTAGSDTPGVGSGKKENAPDRIENVMNKPAQGFRVRRLGQMAHQNPEFRHVAEYVRERRRCQRFPDDFPELRVTNLACARDGRGCGGYGV